MRVPTLCMPVGIVASGKTTFSRQWAKENDPTIIIEVDKFRTLFHDVYTFDPEEENIIWDLVVKATSWWLDWNVNVVVDDAVFFLKKSNRIQFLSDVSGYCPFEYEVEWDFMPMPTDEQVAERRGREGRGYSVEEWLEVARRQRSELEKD